MSEKQSPPATWLVKCKKCGRRFKGAESSTVCPNCEDFPKVQPFTRMDWNGFAGAEPFADGSDPLISYHLKVTECMWCSDEDTDIDNAIILDKNGISICFEECSLQLDVTNRFVATVFANELLSHTWKVEGLLKIGFELV